MTIAELVKESFDQAEKSGWHVDWHPATKLLLSVSEITEGFEEIRNGHAVDEIYFGQDGKPEGMPIELADVLIRIADFCGYYDIDLEAAIKMKAAYNATRPYRHGGKKA